MSDAAAHKEAIIRWLHLSDLHFGCPGREAWWQAHDVFRRSIVELSAELGGPPHLVLITGDLTYSGQRKEFDQLDQFCSALSGWISQGSAAGRPLLVAVPGNHDVTRPGDEAFRYAYLDLYEEEHLQSLRHKLWEKRDSGPVRPLFKSYQAWVQREMLPRLEARRSNTADGVLEFRTSYFPGDFSLILGVGGFRLGLVGLNSAWMQYREGDFQGRLQLPASQFLAALPQSQGHPLDFFKRCQRTMLLTHHPVDWLAPRARAEFENQVLLPDRFALHLHGHLHRQRVEPVQLVAGRPRYTLQAASLFGTPCYGPRDEQRSFGYSWGCIRSSGEIWVWPLQPVLRPDGLPAFERERSFSPHWNEGAVLLRPPDLLPRQGPEWSLPLAR